MDTAVEQFARRGYHDTSMNDLAEAAGVTKPVLYQHFSSKRELYREVIVEIGERLRDRIEKATTDAVSPRGQLESGLTAYFSFVAENNDAFTLMFGKNGALDDDVVEETERVQQSMADLVTELIAIEHLDAEQRRLLAYGVVGLAESCCRHWLSREVDVSPEQLSRRVAQLAWAGLRGVR